MWSLWWIIRLSECWQESLFMPQLMKSATASTGFSFLLSFQTHVCSSKHGVYFLSTTFSSSLQKTLLQNSLLQFCHLLCLHLLFVALESPFLITAKKTDLAFSYMELKFLKLLKKAYKSKSTWSAHVSWWGQLKLEENLFYYVLILAYIS